MAVRAYYYGEDGSIEHALAQLEGSAATLFRNVIEGGTIPRPISSDHGLLVNFIATLLGRTQSAENELNELVDLFGRHMLARSRPDLAAYLDGVTISWNNAVVVALSNALSPAPLLWDLHFRVLTAQRGMEFITSDNPVVLFNQKFGRADAAMARGMANAGLQIYLPISPTRAFLFYDPRWYSPKHGRSGMAAAFPIDTRQLNALQYVNAREHVYWSSPSMDNEVQDIHNNHSKDRPIGTAKIQAEVIAQEGGTTRELLTLVRPRSTLHVQLHLLNLLPPPGGPVPVVRSPEWTMVVRDFSDAVRNGRQLATNFFEFMGEHPLSAAALKNFVQDKR